MTSMTFQTSHLVFWLAAIPAAGLVYVFGIAIYRLFFHPLSKYPGPLLAKLTDGYSLYHAWKGDRHLDFWRLHERYGPVVRFGPNSLSFNTSTSLKAIYSHSANVLKSDFYDAFVGAAPSTHSTRDKADHARKRRVLSHAFSPRAMREVEQYILASERTLARRVGESATPERKGWSAPQNMTHWFNYLATDILGDLCFGKAFHMLEKEDNRYVVDLVASATKRHIICGTMPIIHKLGIDKWLFPGIAARRAKYFEYSRAVLTERTNFGEKHDRPDFFYHLMKAKDPETGKGFTTPELWGESNLLIIAGSDTTSTALAATVFYLVRDIPALEKVTSEVRAKFASVDDIRQGPALNELTYLRACIDEAMRLSPSVGGILPREVQRGGLIVDGHAVPAGTVVGTPHYAIHHNAAYFARPFAFLPERWLAGAKNPETGRPVRAEEVEEAAAAFCPFSVGPRGCIGKEVAYLEMKTALARLLFLYDLRKARDVADPAEGKEGAELGREKVGEFQLFDTFTSWKDGPMVEFRLRDGVEAA